MSIKGKLKGLGRRNMKNLSGLLIALITLAACGSNPAPVVPPPSPANTNGLGACNLSPNTNPNAIQGYATLQPRFGGQNSLQVTATAMNQSQGLQYSGSLQNVIGTGCLLLGDLPGILAAIGYRGQANVNQTIPLSSTFTGMQNPGTFFPGNASLSLAMSGTFPIQLVSPFTGYPGSYVPGGGTGTGMGTEIITVRILQAQVFNYRLRGQVYISIGQGAASQANTILYYAE